VISNTIENSHIYNLLGAGVDYYICKNCNSAEILMALESAVKGEKYFSSSILDILIGKTFGEPVAREVELTSRQKELVVLIGNGNTAKEISKELNISVHTIYTHRKNIMKKLKLKSPVELITYAINIGLVEI
ncbi:MAG: DNA-binding NarL/FixJ family response regulator, partial [Saprospiraceae bacterium]